MNISLVSFVAALISWVMVPSALASAIKQDKIVIAHRGASAYLPEHTLEAKAMAYAMGANFLEQDLVLTKDGVPVVLHDHHLDTTSDVATKFSGRARKDGRFYVIDFTLAEIKTLNVHERVDLKTGKAVFPNRYPVVRSTFKISTFEEEILMIQGLNKSTGGQVGIYPEIKSPAFHRNEGQDISKIVLAILAKHGYKSKEDAVYVQCFDWNETTRIRGELGYQGKLVQLLGENAWSEAPDVDFDALRTAEGLKRVATVADAIGPWLNHLVVAVDEGHKIGDLVRMAHQNGLKVHPYTARADALPPWASSFEQLMEIVLFEAKADGLFSDFPDLTRQYLDHRRSLNRFGKF